VESRIAVNAPLAPAAEPGSPRPKAQPAWERLEEQIAWYDKGSARHKAWYMRLKVVQIVTAAFIPVLATAWPHKAWIGGGLGAVIVVLEGLQQLFQHHANWTTYRSTCEALRHEKHLWPAGSGPYAAHASSDALLAERIEGLVSQENSAWASTRSEQAGGA
jgi:hypothetical protein